MTVRLGNTVLAGTPEFKNYTTNRILEIPQNINLELNNGTLTLKAGSKVYIPKGFESDGTTPKFEIKFFTTDVNLKINWSASSGYGYIYIPLDGSTYQNFVLEGRVYSGNSTPTTSNGTNVWYDIATNKIKRTYNAFSTIDRDDLSLPIAKIHMSSGVADSIDQVFNGFGYIGSTMFALPGVKVQIPNGKNEDGSYDSNIVEITSVKTYTFTSESGGVKIYYDSTISGIGAAYTGTYIYDSETNSYLNRSTGLHTISLIEVADFICSSGKISNFKSADVDSVANSNMSNISSAGRSFISELGMPSSNYIDLTLGASGSSYTAPANGYINVIGSGTPSSAVNNIGYLLQNLSAHMLAGDQDYSSQGQYHVYSATIPCKKGDLIQLNYYGGITTSYFRVIYAEGEI